MAQKSQSGHFRSLQGYILAANSAIQDPNFSRTVVFIIEHDESGAFGLIINRPENFTLKRALGEELPQLTEDISIYQGGPVRPEALFILHSDALADETESEEVIPGVFFGSNRNLLLELLENPYPFHVYHGYAGWGPGQLEHEIQENSWVEIHATEDIIFSEEPVKLWREALNHRGGLFAYFAEKIRDPFLN